VAADAPAQDQGNLLALKITSITDPDNHQTAFTYTSYSGRVSGVTRADQTTESLTPQQMTALNPPGNTTAWLSVEAGADYTDPRGKLWTDTLDWSGFGDAWESFDPLLNETITHRDTNGFPCSPRISTTTPGRTRR